MNAQLPTVGKDLVAKCGSVYFWEIKEKKGSQSEFWTLDLTSGNGKITKGKEGKADATFFMLDSDFMKLVDGKLPGHDAFSSGKLKIKGNMDKAMRFTSDLLPGNAKI